MNSIIQMFAAFAAGVGTSLTPCVYPMLPITLGYLGASSSAQGQGKRKVIGFVTGQILAFTVLGVLAVTLGEFLGFSSQIPWVQISVGGFLLVAAFLSYSEKLPGFLYKLNNVSKFGSSDSYLGALLVGASAALVASPCTSPILGGVLANVAQVENRAFGIFLMFLYALGLSSLFLLIGLGLTKAKTLPKAGLWMKRIHKTSSVLLALGGLYFLAIGFRLL